MEIYKEYKLTLMGAEQNEGDLKEIASENLYQDTVAMEVSLEKDNFGSIIRISPDYFVYLGHLPERDSPISTNVNILVPDLFQDIHGVRMRNTTALYKISNGLRDVTVNKFDGYLAKARMVIKILPNLNEYMSSVLVLRVQPNKTSSAELTM